MPPTDTAPATVADARAVLARLRETRGRMTPGEYRVDVYNIDVGYDDWGWRIATANGAPTFADDAWNAQGIAALVNAADALIAVAEAAAGLEAAQAEYDALNDQEGNFTMKDEWALRARVLDARRVVQAALAAVAGLKPGATTEASTPH